MAEALDYLQQEQRELPNLILLEVHIERIKRRIGADGKAGIVRYAIRNGILEA